MIIIIHLSKDISYDTSKSEELCNLQQKIKVLKNDKLNDIKVQIEHANIIGQTELSLYNTITASLPTISDFQYQYLKPSNKYEPSTLFTYVDNTFYILPTVEKQEYSAYALIDKLLYECQRHLWNEQPCVALRQVIRKFLPESANQGKSYFEQKLSEKETQESTYFGDYLSDDSDSEDESEFKKLLPEKTKKKLKKSDTWRERADDNKYKEHMTGYQDPPIPNLKSRPIIQRDSVVDCQRAESALNKINNEINSNRPLTEEFLNSLNTKFVVAQYRGIHYVTSRWDMLARREHRKWNEVGKPQYSSSALRACNITTYHEYMDRLNTDPTFQDVLKQTAEQLQNSLLAMQNTNPVSWNGYVYLSLFHLLQYWYSYNYDDLPTKLAADLDKKERSHFINFLLNAYRPLLSTSDVPYHALKYAYGIKLYEGHQDERLRPRWRKDGRAERPYSGKVYVSLHPLNDYTNRKPSHLTSIFKQGLAPLINTTVTERETSFLGYLPENRVVTQHVAKYPSFKGPYKTIYVYKYGITEAMYNELQTAFATFLPHSLEKKRLIHVLGEYLCAYQEVRLVEKARRKALKQQDAVLIYRNEDGGFSLCPPETPTTRNGRLNPVIRAKRELYRALAPNNRKIITTIERSDFDEGVEKIEYIQEYIRRVKNLEATSDELDELKQLSMETLELLNSNLVIDLIADNKLEWDSLVTLSEDQLKIICQDTILELINEEETNLTQLINLSGNKFELLDDEQLLDLLQTSHIKIDEVKEINVGTLTSLLEYENLQQPLANGYTIIELADKYKEDPLHIECLTTDDLTDLVLERAPHVPELILDYTKTQDVDFSWVENQLGETDKVLFNITLQNHFNYNTDEENEEECASPCP